MSGKRPAGTNDPSGGPRHFKQTRLNFFTASPRDQPKRLRLAPQESRDEPTTAKASMNGEADTEKGQSLEHRSGDTLDRPSDQVDSDIKDLNTSTPALASSSESSAPEPSPTPAADPAPSGTTSRNKTPPPPSPGKICITDRTGDLFAAPSGTLLIHACNTLGSWGGGIALAFRNLYPAAFQVYRAHCARSAPDQLLGTALLIPPQRGNSNSSRNRGHYIGCLFTSRRYGKARDPPGRILGATAPAMRHLMRLVVEEEVRAKGAAGITEVRMCRINSGLFAVPWERSKRAVEEMVLGEGEVPRCADEEGCLEVVAYERE